MKFKTEIKVIDGNPDLSFLLSQNKNDDDNYHYHSDYNIIIKVELAEDSKEEIKKHNNINKIKIPHYEKTIEVGYKGYSLTSSNLQPGKFYLNETSHGTLLFDKFMY